MWLIRLVLIFVFFRRSVPGFEMLTITCDVIFALSTAVVLGSYVLVMWSRLCLVYEMQAKVYTVFTMLELACTVALLVAYFVLYYVSFSLRTFSLFGFLKDLLVVLMCGGGVVVHFVGTHFLKVSLKFSTRERDQEAAMDIQGAQDAYQQLP